MKVMYTKNIRNWVEMLKDGELFFAKQTYADYFADMQENTFYQLLARLCNEGTIQNLSKGLYFKPYSNDHERKPSKQAILDFLTNRGRNGCKTGADFYKNKGIIDYDVDYEYVFTNLLEIKSVRKIDGMSIYNLEVDFRNESYVNIIEFLELVEHIESFNNVNYEALHNYLRSFASRFSQSALLKVISLRKYKKRVIAALVLVLTKFNVINTLQKLLNKASKYEIPEAIQKALEWE